MKKHMNFLLLLTVFAVTTFSRIAPALAENPDDILIVAHLKVPVDTVDVTELKAIYLRKKFYWSMGQDVLPLNAKFGTRLREVFQSRILGMAPEEELRYWERQKIERALSPPPEFATTQKAVFNLKNSVSYVFRKDFKANVNKILLVILAE